MSLVHDPIEVLGVVPLQDIGVACPVVFPVGEVMVSALVMDPPPIGIWKVMCQMLELVPVSSIFHVSVPVRIRGESVSVTVRLVGNEKLPGVLVIVKVGSTADGGSTGGLLRQTFGQR